MEPENPPPRCVTILATCLPERSKAVLLMSLLIEQKGAVAVKKAQPCCQMKAFIKHARCDHAHPEAEITVNVTQTSIQHSVVLLLQHLIHGDIKQMLMLKSNSCNRRCLKKWVISFFIEFRSSMMIY